MTPFELVLSKLPDAKRTFNGYEARCPAHDDTDPSLSVSQADDGRALIHCHAGCAPEKVVTKLGLVMADLMPDQSNGQCLSRSESVTAAKSKVFETEHEAVKALERKLGPSSTKWIYQDVDGNTVGFVIRWDTKNGKEIRPISRSEAGYLLRGMPEPRPLYRLPELHAAGAKRVYVCEGEKAVDAARSIGLVATTSPHGSKSAAKADWSPLAGCEVVILPDADNAGEKYAEDVIQMLARLEPRPSVKVVRFEELPFGEGGDIVDLLSLKDGDAQAVRGGIDELVDKADAVELASASDKLTKPTKPLIESFEPFPVDALPAPVAGFVRECSASIGCDPSFVALPVLVGLAAMIGNSRRIQLKQGWTEPAILWGAVVGESGTAKSPALELALRPIRKAQQRSMRQHDTDCKAYDVERQKYDRDYLNWKKSNDGDDPPVAPEEPKCDRCWTDDVTIEALATLLQENPRGMLVTRDELSGWLHFDRYKATGKGAEAAKWLEAFGGRPLIVDRKTSGTIYVPRAAVSIIGGIQPGILARCVGQEHRDNGLLARLLLVMPPRRPKRWSEADLDPNTEAGIAKIFEGLRALPFASTPDDEPAPAVVQLAPDGKRAWTQFFDEHNQEQVELSGDLAAAWSKFECYVPRIALIHYLVRLQTGEATGDSVDATSMNAAIAIVRWFAREARRVYALLNADEDARQRSQWRDLIERKGGRVTVRDWQRSRSHNTSDEAKAELQELVAAGYGQLKTNLSGSQGGRPSMEFVLHPPTESKETNASPASGGLDQTHSSTDDDEWGTL